MGNCRYVYQRVHALDDSFIDMDEDEIIFDHIMDRNRKYSDDF